jgi:DNA-directed RNA polymerase specialized sigma24 family protein
LADLYQEGRIAVFLAAEEIAVAASPEALVKTVVRRQAVDAIRTQADRFPPPRKPGEGVSVTQAVQPA